MTVPAPPPGFTLVDQPTSGAGSIPSPPPGFQIVGGAETPTAKGAIDYGLDFTRPDETIRQKIAALPLDQQKRAHDLWAEERVRRLTAKGITPRPFLGEGIPIIGSVLDEASAGLNAIGHSISGGAIGRPYDEALAETRALSRAADTAHPLESAAGKLATGVVTGGPVLGRLAPAPTLVGRTAQGVGLGAGIGTAEGLGRGEGTVENRLASGIEGGQVGAVLGGVLPIAAAVGTRAVGAVGSALGPTMTRLRYGPAEAADEILARRLETGGTTPAQVRLDLQRGQARSAQMGANSRADLPEAIADTSDDLQRMTGSLYRAGGDAGNLVRQTLESRQRGPANPYAPQAGEPVGQRARIMDATARALQIRTSNSALMTERQILAEQRSQGTQLYQDAFRTQQPFDIQPVLDGFALQAQQYPAPFQARMIRALNLFRDNTPTRMPVTRLERFDAAKKSLDDMIESAQRQGQGNLVRELTGFKRVLIDTVEANGQNAAYRTARESWGSAAENREAIELGRSALREGSELSVEQYNSLTRGQQQLFRIGFLESLRNALGTRKPGNDVTQLFQQQRVQELLNEIIPRSRGNGVFADRPARFGDLMRREERMVQTRNAALGNSATAQRQQDDMAYAGSTLRAMYNRFVHAPTLYNAVVESLGAGIERFFGYRQDVALELARRLLETDPTARNQILRRLSQRGGANRFREFADMMDRSNTALIGATAGPVQIEDQRGR